MVQGRNRQMASRSFIGSLFWRAREKNIGIKFSPDDRAMIEVRLMKFDKDLLRKIEGLCPRFRVDKVLLAVKDDSRICWYDAEKDIIVINLHHDPACPEFDGAFEKAAGFAREMSPRYKQ